jgi:prepilin-type processing-associated H-X9-DG protein
MSVVCQSNLKQLGLTFSLYTWDNHGYFHREDSSDWRDNWIPAMRAYYSHEPGIRVCPTTTRFHSEGVTGPFVGWGVYGEGRLQSVPSWAVRGDYGSFGLNAWVANDRGGFHEGRNSRSVQVQGGHQIPVFLDCQWPDALPEVLDMPPEFDGEYALFWHTNGMRSFCMNRHNGSVNAVFLDGSVRPVGLKELWNLQWHRRWREELAAVGTPIWPEWMRGFRDY